MAGRTVIVVPGFLCSTLYLRLLGRLLGRAWLNPGWLAFGGFTRLRLPVASEGGGPEGLAALAPGQPLEGMYTLATLHLSALGWRITAADADWRRPVLHDGLLLAAKIRLESGAAPVQLLAHSRGGLVARAALQILDAAGEGWRVERVVGLGVPHTGAWAAAAMMGCYHSAKLTFSLLTLALPNLGGGKTTPALVSEVARTWPGLYELLPSPDANWLSGISAPALYSGTTWSGSPFDPVSDYLAGAQAHWSQLPLNPTGCEWIDVVGYGSWTPSGVRDGGDPRVLADVQGDDRGDGTVRADAAHPVNRPVILTPAVHDLLPSDGRALKHIDSALRGQFRGSQTIVGNLIRV